jgi:hypothetical protein
MAKPMVIVSPSPEKSLTDRLMVLASWAKIPDAKRAVLLKLADKYSVEELEVLLAF